MAGDFCGAWLKLERAKHHINDLYAKGQVFGNTHPHRLSIEIDTESGDDALSIAPAEQFPDEFLAILGDAIHNLRSALDHAWFQSVTSDPDHRNFPVKKTRDDLKASINGLKENASEEVKRFIVDVIQPYEGGDGEILLGLHSLDIEDKHRLLIAYRQFAVIRGLSAVDDRDVQFPIGDWLIVHPHTATRTFEGHRKFKITNYGSAVTRVTFGEGSVLKGHAFMPTFQRLTNIVERVVRGLESVVCG